MPDSNFDSAFPFNLTIITYFSSILKRKKALALERARASGGERDRVPGAQ